MTTPHPITLQRRPRQSEAAIGGPVTLNKRYAGIGKVPHPKTLDSRLRGNDDTKPPTTLQRHPGRSETEIRDPATSNRRTNAGGSKESQSRPSDFEQTVRPYRHRAIPKATRFPIVGGNDGTKDTRFPPARE